MGNWVIVAIPEKDDSVWKFSSEKVPHLTILSLGEHEAGPESAHILSYIEHAANTMLHKFHMSVDKRDTLGPNEADVLLFDKGWHGQEIVKFRDALLKEPHIKEWFDGSDQFPEWLPHLTMGFPETPAHEDDRDYPGIHGVHFDRIALWTGDYDGPEVDLNSYRDLYDSTPALVQSMEAIDHEMAVVASYREVTVDDLQHADRTLADVMGDMSADDREIFDIIVGATLEGTDLSVDPSYAEAFDSLEPIAQAIAAFVVGSAQSSDMQLEHSALDSAVEVRDEDLLQYGKKGMKWGVRNDDSGSSGPPRMSKILNSTINTKEIRKDARAQVKAGTASLAIAHVAAVKSTGHRVTNGVLGDKTYWKRAAAIAGVGATVGAGLALAPAALPAGALLGITHLTAGTISSVGTIAAATAYNTAALTNYISNGVRAVTGNKKVDASFSKLGRDAMLRQNQGTKAIQKTLRKNGSLRKKDLRQSMDLAKSVSAMEKPIDLDVLHGVGAYLAQYDMELFPLTASLEVSEEDALQYGKRGMKWGVRHLRGLNGRVTSKEIPADAKEAILLKTKVKKNKGTHVLSNEDLEKLNKRINLENSYSKASKEQSLLIKTHGKVKTALDLGKTANSAIAFTQSDAGKLLLEKMGYGRGGAGKHAKGVPQLAKKVAEAAGGKHSK